jgi:hypothetical protein
MKKNEYQHLRFEELTPNPKTKRFIVYSKHDKTDLGTIRWYAGWRQYVFFPIEDCVWSHHCLKELSIFIEELMLARKNTEVKVSIPPKDKSSGILDTFL